MAVTYEKTFEIEIIKKELHVGRLYYLRHSHLSGR